MLPENLDGGYSQMEVPLKISPANINAYHQAYNPAQTYIYTTSGQAYLITKSVKEFEDMMKSYWMQVAVQLPGGKNGKIVSL